MYSSLLQWSQATHKSSRTSSFRNYHQLLPIWRFCLPTARHRSRTLSKAEIVHRGWVENFQAFFLESSYRCRFLIVTLNYQERIGEANFQNFQGELHCITARSEHQNQWPRTNHRIHILRYRILRRNHRRNAALSEPTSEPEKQQSSRKAFQKSKLTQWYHHQLKHNSWSWFLRITDRIIVYIHRSKSSLKSDESKCMTFECWKYFRARKPAYKTVLTMKKQYHSTARLPWE